MARHDRQEPLQTLAPALNDLVREPVREDLAGKGWDVDSRGLVLKDIAEGLEVRVPPADDRVAELEGRDVRLLWFPEGSVHGTQQGRISISGFRLGKKVEWVLEGGHKGEMRETRSWSGPISRTLHTIS